MKITRSVRTAAAVLAAVVVATFATPTPPALAAGITVSVYDYRNPSVPGQNVKLYADAWGSGCSIRNYSWNYGDGSAQSGPSLYSVSHSWSTTGSKAVTVTVTDYCGNSTTATTTHTVVADDPPTADFTLTVKSNNPLAVYADPTGSSDTDPTGLYYYEYYWGDGQVDGVYASNNGGIATHTYATAGTYSVTMYAYDTAWKRSAPVTKSITVGAQGPSCTIKGTTGNDVLTGTAGDDVICGLEGNDIVKGQGGNDTLIGGPGKDKVDYANATAGVTVNLAAGTANGQGSDTLREIEDVDGSPFADRFDGDASVNWLAGKGGNDTVAGQAGNDQIWGGDGTDTVGGGEGDDRMNGGPGIDTVKYNWAVSLDLGAGTASGTAGNDTLLAIENAIGSPSVDSIAGSSVANNIQGGGGNDTLLGVGAADRISGQAGNDYLIGGDGTDHCDGGTGTDTATTCETKVSVP